MSYKLPVKQAKESPGPRIPTLQDSLQRVMPGPVGKGMLSKSSNRGTVNGNNSYSLNNSLKPNPNP